MSWQENRRRKRTWYRHYKKLCDKLMGLASDSRPVAGEAIIKMFFELYEQRRLHKRKRVAESAWESLELACRDSGLTRVALQPTLYGPVSGRPDSAGAFGDVDVARKEPGTVRFVTLNAERESLEKKIFEIYNVKQEELAVTKTVCGRCSSYETCRQLDNGNPVCVNEGACQERVAGAII